MRVLIIEGSQSPPTFIQNLIQGLLGLSVEVGLLGRDKGKDSFQPDKKKSFTRILSDYSRFNVARYVVFFFATAIMRPMLLIRAFRLYDRTPSVKLNFKRWTTLAKILIYNPDVIHFQWVSHITEYRSLLKKSTYKIVVSLRGRQINVTPQIDKSVADSYRELFPFVNHFHAVSHSISLRTLEYGVPESSISVIYSPLPDIFFERVSEKTTARGGKVRIISIGRFHWKKGYTYALEAIRILKRSGIDVSYTIIAQGRVPERILYDIYDLGIQDAVTIVGSVPYERIRDELQSSSIFLLPSLEEGVANVVLEAMAAGLPVVSTDAGGMGEVVISHETGFLIPRWDADAIASAVCSIARMDPKDVDALTERARQKVARQFAYDLQIRKFVEMYSR